MVIITGIGRCGTSFLARWCKESGIDPGGKWTDIVNAGMEDTATVRINEIILGDAQHDEIEIDKYRKAISEIKREIVKDPQFTVGADVLNVWYKIRKDIKLIVLHRNPEFVLKSRLRYDAWFVDRWRGKNINLYKQQFADFITTILRFNIPYKLFYFPTFLKEFDLIYEAFLEYGIKFDYNRSLEVWDSSVDYNKVHFKDNEF